MRYRVITSATVRRTYYVEDATSEKDAMNKSVFMSPDDEEEITEELLVAEVMGSTSTVSVAQEQK